MNFNPNFVFEIMDDEGILVDIKNGKYYQLNKISSIIVAKIQQNFSKKEIIAYLTGLYDVDVNTCEKDFDLLIQQLESIELFEM